MSVLRRLINVLRVLLEAHLTVARTEAERDLGRVMLGVVLLVVAGTCLATAWFYRPVSSLFLSEGSSVFSDRSHVKASAYSRTA